MLKRLVILLVGITIVGCSTQPVPMPPPLCDGVYVPGKGCQSLGADNYGGAVRGHHED